MDYGSNSLKEVLIMDLFLIEKQFFFLRVSKLLVNLNFCVNYSL